MTAGPARAVQRTVVHLAAAAAIGGAVVLAAAPAASAATATHGRASFHIPNPFGGLSGVFCLNPTTPPPPELPGSWPEGAILGPPGRPPAPGDPWAAGSRTTEWQQFGFAGLTWHSYDLGCIPDWISALKTELASIELGAARAVVAIDIAVHNWAAGAGWMPTLAPLVTGATRVVHQDLFTPWAGISLLLLALVLLVRAHRGDFGSAVTAVAWALVVLALVAGVTAYPTWAARQVTSLMAGTINAMDAGFVGQRSEAAAADAHASLLVSAVLYRAWLAGEFGDATSPQARRFGPLLFRAQALTWRQAAGGQAELTATENAKEKQWTAIAAQVKSADPAIYPDLQGTQGSRLGIGAVALIDSVIVCAFDIFASLVIVVAELLVLLVTILLPALALVGLHHDLRFAITGLLSRVAGMLGSAVLYSIAAGVDVRASQFLLPKVGQAGQAGAAGATPAAAFTVMLLQLLMTIALFWAVRKVRTGRMVSAGVLYAGLYGAMFAAGAARGRRGPAAPPDGVVPGAAAGNPPGPAGPGPEPPGGPAPDGTGPAGPPDEWDGGPGDWPSSPVGPGAPPDGPPAAPPPEGTWPGPAVTANGSGGRNLGAPVSGGPAGPASASEPAGTGPIYRGSAALGDDLTLSGQGPGR